MTKEQTQIYETRSGSEDLDPLCSAIGYFKAFIDSRGRDNRFGSWKRELREILEDFSVA